MSMTAMAIMAGMSALGGMAGSKKSQGQSPWGPQAGHLQNIYGQAQGEYNRQAEQGFLSDMERQGINQGQSHYGQMGQIGGNLMGGLNEAYDLSRQDFDGTINYGNVRTNMEQSQPFMDDIIKQSTADIYQQLGEGPLKSANNSAIASGNVNSSRKGVMDAVIGSQGANQASRISADLLGQGYQQALGLEQNRISNDYSQRQQKISNLTGLGQTGMQMGMQGSQGMIQLGSYENNAQNRALQAYQQAVGGPMMTTGETGGQWQDILGGALSGAGTGFQTAGMMSGGGGAWGGNSGWTNPFASTPSPVDRNDYR